MVLATKTRSEYLQASRNPDKVLLLTSGAKLHYFEPQFFKSELAFLFVHGGGFLCDNHRQFMLYAEKFSDLGAHCFCIQFDIPKHTYKKQLECIHDAYVSLLRGGVRRVVLIGASSGGFQLEVLVSRRIIEDKVEGIVLLNPLIETSKKHMLGNVPKEEWPYYTIVENPSRKYLKTLLIFGDQDRYTSEAEYQEFFSSHLNFHPNRLTTIKGGGHGFFNKDAFSATFNIITKEFSLDRNRMGQQKNISKVRFLDSTVHYLHIGKTAGTQIARVSEQINRKADKAKILQHHHDISLDDLPSDACYFFSIRDPVTRFVSGFYSRKRKGRPRYYSEWSDSERAAFSKFEHAEDLAKTLYSESDSDALQAIASIRHLAVKQHEYFKFHGDFLKSRPPMGIVRVENFEEDLQRLITKIDADIDFSELDITTDPVKSHANDYSETPSLSDQSIENLKKYLYEDFVFYAQCTHWIQRDQCL